MAVKAQRGRGGVSLDRSSLGMRQCGSGPTISMLSSKLRRHGGVAGVMAARSLAGVGQEPRFPNRQSDNGGALKS
jgi:hypothetical protein